MMNTPKILLTGLLLAILLGACKDYLDPYPNGNRSEDDVWKYPEMAQGLIGQVYEYIPTNYNNNESAYLDCATDNAVSTSTTRDIRKLAVGAITTGQDPVRTYWDRNYKAIFLCNTFLKDNRGFNLRYLVDPHLDSLVRYRLQGEAYALRAWFQWDLLQKFGGKSLDGNLLGFPIITEPADISSNLNWGRNTYEECVNQILADCDSAYKYLPIAHRDYLVENLAKQSAYAGSRYWGRIDGITTRAIKSLVYLTWASPRFNPEKDMTRWEMAAKYAKEVMDFKLTVDNVKNGFNPITAINWVNPQFPGIIWVSRYSTGNDAMERMFYPGSFQGNGTMGATQELVDAFPMKNGYPITDPRSGYDPQDPYKDRDPRFYSTIFHNAAAAVRISGAKDTMFVFETFEGGKDAPGTRPDNSRTGYHIKKFVYMGLNWSDNSIDRQRHSNFLIRWAHMVLTFAEAANQVVGPTDNAKFGISAKEAITYLRTRRTEGNKGGILIDPYLNEVAAAGKEEFDKFIRNERRIETCFEGMRFYDLRRWETPVEELNKPVHGIQIDKNEDGSLKYQIVEIEPRSYQSPYLPIPYDEMLRMSKLEQNEGWESWK